MANKILGVEDIARLCNVTPDKALRWLQEERLAYFSANGKKAVWDVDLAAFLKRSKLPVPSELLAGEGRSVLIVDDETNFRYFMVENLKRSHPHVSFYEAENGFEAGCQMSSLLPSVVVLDVMLPGIDGFGICRMIRRDPKFRSVKILVISGLSEEELRMSAADAGVDAFLAKPFEMDQLTEILDRLMGTSDRATGKR